MQTFIQNLKKEFDVIIFDTPPVLPVTDALLLAPKLDGVLLINNPSKETRDTLMQAKRLYERAGAHLIGAVLNAIDTASSGEFTSIDYKYHYTEEEMRTKY